NEPAIQLDGVKIRSTYNLLHARNFDPNTQEYIVYVQEVDKSDLPELLIELSKVYFEQLGQEKNLSEKPAKPKERQIKEAYQCRDCLTVYDASYGDPSQHIPADTPFEDLPDAYHCSLCEAPKSSFVKKKFVKQPE